MTRERQVLLRVLKMYRDTPLLWDKTHKDYKNQPARSNALHDILEVYKEIDGSATKKIVTKKLSNIRTNYYKELNKVRKAAQNGELYEPTLWYYQSLSFLENGVDELPSKESLEILELESSSQHDSKDWTNDTEGEVYFIDPDLEDSNDSHKDPFQAARIIVKQESSRSKEQESRKRKRLSNSIYSSGTNILKEDNVGSSRSVVETSYEQEFDAYGKYVASALKSMPIKNALNIQLKFQSILTEAKIESLEQE